MPTIDDFDLINNNPFRDMKRNPIRPNTVAGLVFSYKKTAVGFWDNIGCRPLDNMIDGKVVTQKQVDARIKKDKGIVTFPVQAWHGHHRVAAFGEGGIKSIDIPVKVLSNEEMWQMMVLENKDDQEGGIPVILETVRTGRDMTQDEVNTTSDFKDYEDKGYTVYTRSQAYASAKDKGVGFKAVLSRLGDAWSKDDIQKAVALLSAIEEGGVDQSDVAGMSSIGQAYAFIKLAEKINETDYPVFFKDLWIDEAIEVICDESKGATIKTIKGAARLVKNHPDSINPAAYMDKRSTSKVDMVSYFATAILAPDVKMELDDLSGLEGVEDSAGWSEMFSKIEDRVTKAREKAEEGEGSEIEDTTDEAEAAIAGAEADANDLTGDLDSLEVEFDESSPAALAPQVGQAADHFIAATAKIKGNCSELDSAMKEGLVVKMLHTLVAATHILQDLGEFEEAQEAVTRAPESY